jgi:hypothetical protein
MITAVRAETDQWMAGLREEILAGDPVAEYVSGRIADAVANLHPGTAGLGAAIVTAARAALEARDWLENHSSSGRTVSADALANLIGIAGLALIDREEAGGS